ncbi:MAG: sulfatase-like hydrolase/transferase [Actinomycetota bacterium]
MDRRNFIKATAATAAVTATGLTTATPAGAAEEGRAPNLLVIMTDQQNFRTVGRHRALLSSEQAHLWGKGNIVRTPNIDRLALRGVLASNFYSTSPICSPARAAFMTGTYTPRNRVLRNDDPMVDGVSTFAEPLRAAGYATGYAGKWHLEGDAKPGWKPARTWGFDDRRHMFNRGHDKKVIDTPNGPRMGADGAIGDGESYMTDWLTDKTLDFIDEHSERPFCYMVSYPDPHTPLRVREPYRSMYADMDFTLPRTAGRNADGKPKWAQPKQKRFNMSNYYGMISLIDDSIGRIMERLKSHRLLRHTIVVFCADHGEMAMEHSRVGKTTPYESAAKVPFIVRAPRLIQRNAVIDDVMAGVDVAPTLLDIMGVRPDGVVDGRSAKRLFTEGTAPSNWNDVAMLRGYGNDGWVAAVDRRHKLVFTKDAEPWLLDRDADPDELRNFYKDAAYRGVRRDLATATIDYASDHNEPLFKRVASAQDQLKAAAR